MNFQHKIALIVLVALLPLAITQPETIIVPLGADLQAFINSAPVGSILQLTDGGEYGAVVVNKSLTIQAATKAVIRTRNADPAVLIPPKTGHVTLKNLELTTDPTWPQVNDIIRWGDGGAAQDSMDEVPQGLTIENCDIHGQPNQDIQRGISANGANFKLIKSKVREIHGRGYDTQAVCVWNGPGPFLIEGSYLEAAGENVMFGGSLASIPNLIPTDIVVRNNHFFKPLSWYINDPSYAGIKWSVKNLFELKNARRVLVEGNIFDGNWTDAQTGRAIQFTPRPSDSGSWAVIEDVQFINNIIRNTGAGLNVLGADEPPAPTETRLRRVRIANNLWDINGRRFGSDGVFLVVTNRTEDVTVENNTVFQTGNIISTDYAPNIRFIYRNNISRHNEYGIFGSGKGTGNTTINFYFPEGVVTGNVIAKEVKGESSPSNHESVYPAGNFFPETLADVGFVDLGGGNLRLSATSPYKGKGSNGSDPGCNIDALNAAIGGALPTPTVSPTPIASPSATPTPGPTPGPTTEPTPTPSTSSPDGTKATTIVDSQMATWTIGAQKETLRNGSQAGGGQGTIYKYFDKTVYVFGLDSDWYKWSGSWSSVGVLEPGGTPIPEPTPDPTPEPTPFPCTLDAPASISVPPNGVGKIGVSLNSMTPQVDQFLIRAVSNTAGQVSVFPDFLPVTGTSAVIEFGVRVKKRSAIITFTSPCPTKTTVVMVR